MESTRPAVSSGALVGLLLGAASLGVQYPLGIVLKSGFAPYDLFGWLSRILPGGLVTFGLESLLGMMRLLGFPLAEAGKAGQAVLAISIYLAGAALVGTLIFMVLRRAGRPMGIPTRLVLGALVSLPLLVAINAVSTLQDTTILYLHYVIVLLISVAWMLLLIWSYDRLAALPPAQEGPRGEVR